MFRVRLKHYSYLSHREYLVSLEANTVIDSYILIAAICIADNYIVGLYQVNQMGSLMSQWIGGETISE